MRASWRSSRGVACAAARAQYDDTVNVRRIQSQPELLFASSHRSIYVDGENRRVSVVRTSVAVSSLDECAHEYIAALRAMEPLARAQMSLLLDVRLAPLCNDAALEETVAPYRKAMCAGFQRAATLVAGSVQQLQFTRYGREDELGMRVFNREALALAFLQEGRATETR